MVHVIWQGAMEALSLRCLPEIQRARWTAVATLSDHMLPRL